MHKTPKPGTAPRALAGAQTPAQTPSPAPFIGLSPPTSPRRAKNQTANPTSPRYPRHHRGDSLGGASGDDDGRTPSGAIATRKPRRGVAASLDDLVHWRRPARTAKVAGGGFYLMLCVGSLRQMPLPAGTVACYAFIFALAASLFTRLFQRVRRNLGFGLGIGGMDAAAMEAAKDFTRKKREARVRLMAAKFGKPVCPHAGGVGLCEYVQHLSIFDHIRVGGARDDRVLEFVDHLHEHFVEPVRIVDGHYAAPERPGFSIEMVEESRTAHEWPGGAAWASRSSAR